MRILIPVDGSTCSRAAVRFIGARSKFMGEKPDVTLLNVQQNIPGTVIEHFSLEAVRSVYEAEGKAIVEKLAPEIEAYGIEPHMAVRIDDCGPAVAKIAVDENIDLITMGSRGLSPVTPGATHTGGRLGKTQYFLTGFAGMPGSPGSRSAGWPYPHG